MKISELLLSPALDSPGIPSLASETKAMTEASSLSVTSSLSSAKKGVTLDAPARGTAEAGVFVTRYIMPVERSTGVTAAPVERSTAVTSGMR